MWTCASSGTDSFIMRQSHKPREDGAAAATYDCMPACVCREHARKWLFEPERFMFKVGEAGDVSPGTISAKKKPVPG